MPALLAGKHERVTVIGGCNSNCGNAACSSHEKTPGLAAAEAGPAQRSYLPHQSVVQFVVPIVAMLSAAGIVYRITGNSEPVAAVASIAGLILGLLLATAVKVLMK